MKIKFQEKERPKLGDTRIISKFLLFPKYLENELRWLEYVQIEQVYRHTYSCAPGMKPMKTLAWMDQKWII